MGSVGHKELVEYYSQFKRLVELHQKFQFGTSPRTSEGFTELICCALFPFERATFVSREFDLIDRSTNEKIEVKATTHHSGSTTINPNSNFDYLYWLIFRLDHDALWINIFEKNELSGYLDEKKGKKRINVTLSKFKSSKFLLYFFDFESSLIRQATTTEYLDYMKRYFEKKRLAS